MEENIAIADYFYNSVQADLVKQFNNKFGATIPSKAWRERILYGFGEQSFSEYKELKFSYDNGRSLSAIAFHSRNLLELKIWVHHCLADEKNLRSFFEDAGRDGRQLIDAFVNWEGVNSELGQQAKAARDKLEESAKNHGVESIDGTYQSVGNVANLYPELSSYYKVPNKMLSKFAHPTALTILGLPNTDVIRLKDSFYNLGCICFSAATRALAINMSIELLYPYR